MRQGNFFVAIIPFPFSQALRRLVHRTLVLDGIPKAVLARAFQKATLLLLHRLDNRLADQELGVFGTGPVEGSIGTN